MNSIAKPNVNALMADMAAKTKTGAEVLRLAPSAQRTQALTAMSAAIRAQAGAILEANAKDVEAASAKGSSPAMIERLVLNPARIKAMAEAVEAISAQADPVGRELARWTRPNGLDIARIATPIGVIAIIFESRPNVTADAAALCLRSGNAAILRSGSEAFLSAAAIFEAVREGLRAADLPESALQLVPTTDRDAVGAILSGLDKAINLIIPRGGKSLVARVQAEARAPVLAHLEGINHTYVHAAADPAKAVAVVVNAKMRRVSVCGATETLLIDAAIAPSLLPELARALIDRGCELRGDDAARAIVPMTAAAPEDWDTEYLAPILAVKLVDGLDAAMDHIRNHGSGHTEAILTEDAQVAKAFENGVDAAIVMVNASTQFADGGEFGMGAEIGISTDRLHARGPVGAEQLCSFKYVVRGAGQVRA